MTEKMKATVLLNQDEFRKFCHDHAGNVLLHEATETKYLSDLSIEERSEAIDAVLKHGRVALHLGEKEVDSDKR